MMMLSANDLKHILEDPSLPNTSFELKEIG